MEERARQSLVRMALKDIADAMGDVDAFIAQYDPAMRKAPKIAAEIAVRLLAAGREGDALGFLERAEFRDRAWVPEEWQAARLDVLEALGRSDEAQAFRLECFQRSLAADHLRAYLGRTFKQLAWWALAARHQREDGSADQPAAFARDPSQRNAP